MNNLLRTLTESQVRSEPNLKLLLSTIKDARRQCYDAKLADPFYDSLEGLLHDLRTITMDNHDAEAFLKPVSRADVPDYYDVILNPMDLQTMLKKVKQKQYKTKKEFKDDLDLIWQNCYTYNAAENHPLRLCAKRLQYKAHKLLKNITDRKERTDPPIPTSLGGPKLNGLVNGHSRHHSPLKSGMSAIKHPMKQRQDIPFWETPAITRTPSGMSAFLQLDQGLEREASSKSTIQSHNDDSNIMWRLREFAAPMEYDSDSEDVSSPDGSVESIGDKRKLNGLHESRVHKRARFSPGSDLNEDETDLWWRAVVSGPLLANGVPGIPYSSSRRSKRVTKAGHDPRRYKTKQSKAVKKTPSSQSLLSLMNNNIRTTKRVRRTHAKFAALNANANNEENDWSTATLLLVGEEEVDDVVDDLPWQARASGIELGEENATDCIQWMDMKVLEHVGFQGASKKALDVLAGVTSEYLLNVGRTIRFLCDKYFSSMTAEEIILHTLFESGTSKIQDLEKYIKDDVIRYGNRLSELEKKLESAYREATVSEALDDDALFGADEDGEEEGAFVMGNFADNFGEDFLGLRELGIAAEFGLSSLTIPKKLLRGKGRGENKGMSSAANPAEPPPPFPPPPQFIPLDSSKLDDQIGLLKPFYQGRFAALSALTLSIPSLPPPPLLGSDNVVIVAGSSSPAAVPVLLPDDQPDQLHVKMGPLGQIIKVSSSTTPKKKSKKKDTVTVLDGDGVLATTVSLSTPVPGAPEQGMPKKKKAPGGAASAGGKKKTKLGESLPPVITASA